MYNVYLCIYICKNSYLFFFWLANSTMSCINILYIYTHIYTYIYIHIHTYIHIHIHILVLSIYVVSLLATVAT